MISLKYFKFSHNLKSSGKNNTVAIGLHSGGYFDIKRDANDFVHEEQGLRFSIELKTNAPEETLIYSDMCTGYVDKLIAEQIKETLKNATAQRKAILASAMSEGYSSSSNEVTTYEFEIFIPAQEVYTLTDCNKLWSDFLGFTIYLYDRSTDRSRITGQHGVNHYMLEQFYKRLERIRKRDNDFGSKGIITNYYLNDSQGVIKNLFIRVNGEPIKIEAGDDPQLAEGLWRIVSEGKEDAPHRTRNSHLTIDQLKDPKVRSANGIYLTQLEALDGVESTETLKQALAENKELKVKTNTQENTIANLEKTLQELREKEMFARNELEKQKLLFDKQTNDIIKRETLIKLKEEKLKLDKQAVKQTESPSIFARIKKFIMEALGLGGIIGPLLSGFI